MKIVPLSQLLVNYFSPFYKPFTKRAHYCSGYTLVEVITVIAILGILSSIAGLSVWNSIENSKKEVCQVNRQQLEKHYEEELTIKGKVHSDLVFTEYLQEYSNKICPANGEISYGNGQVRCSLHPNDEDVEDDEDGDEDVPFL